VQLVFVFILALLLPTQTTNVNNEPPKQTSGQCISWQCEAGNREIQETAKRIHRSAEKEQGVWHIRK